MSLPTIESSFVMCTSKGILGFDNPQYPALRVALEIMNATESFLWRYIRGSGLAYGGYLSHDAEAGLLTFTLYRSSNCIQGLEEGAKVVKGLVDGSITMEETDLDAAKSGIIFGTAKSVSTASRAAVTSFINQALKDVPQDYQVKQLEKYHTITKDQVLAALQKYVLPLFDASSSLALVVTAPAKADSITDSLTEGGYKVERRAVEVGPGEADGESSGSEDSSDDEK
jgi:Zn-dependent M16 (insulinase) family peptidase